MDRKTATHEAGHAIGRLLTADILGTAFEDAVLHIDASDPANYACRGPAVPNAVAARLGNMGTSAGRIFWLDVARVSSTTELWAIAYSRLLTVVMGPAAEARLERLGDATPIWYARGSDFDREDFGDTCAMVGAIRPDEVDLYLRTFLPHASDLLRRPAVWGAVESIARELRGSNDVMRGARVAELARPHLELGPELMLQPLPQAISMKRMAEEAVMYPSMPG